MKNQRGTLLGLGVIFAILIAVSILQNRPTSVPVNTTPVPGEVAVNNPFRLFPMMNMADIVAFNILDPDTGASMSYRRAENNSWEMLEFVDFPLNQDTVNALAFTAAVMPYLQKLEGVEPKDYAQFGLVEGRAYLLMSIVLKNGEQHALLLGDLTSDTQSRYGLLDDQPIVYAVDERPIAYMVSYLRQIYLPPTATPAATPTAQ